MRESLEYFLNLQKKFIPKLEDLLIKDRFFYEKLFALKKAILRTKRAYQEAGSFLFCGECARKGVKCCGEGLEWKLSAEEFFLNLALFKLEGKSFILHKDLKDECLFLGKDGCILQLTPLFCRNFFCTELKNFLGEEKLIYLQNVLEEEAILTFELCEYLKKKSILGGSE